VREGVGAGLCQLTGPAQEEERRERGLREEKEAERTGW